MDTGAPRGDTSHNSNARDEKRRAGRPSARAASDLERVVLAAALAEFRAYGFSGGSIERIAEQAAVSRSAIYRKYIDKGRLFSLVVNRQIQELAAYTQNLVIASEDPLERLRATAEAFCEYILSPLALDLQRIVVQEAASSSISGMPKVPPLPTHLSEQLDALIALAQQRGQLKSGEPQLWRDVLLRLVADGPRWDALASGVAWSRERLQADFDRMWPIFLTVAGAA